MSTTAIGDGWSSDGNFLTINNGDGYRFSFFANDDEAYVVDEGEGVGADFTPESARKVAELLNAWAARQPK